MRAIASSAHKTTFDLYSELMLFSDLAVSLTILESRIAFVWQQCLAVGSISPSPSLMKRAVAQLIGIFENGGVNNCTS